MADTFHNSDGDEPNNINLTLLVLKKLPQFSQVDTLEMYEEPMTEPANTNEHKDTINSETAHPDKNLDNAAIVRRILEDKPSSMNNSNNSHLEVMKVIDSVNGKLDIINPLPVSAQNDHHKDSLSSTYKSGSNIDFNVSNHNSGRKAGINAHGDILGNSDTLNLNPTVYNSDFEDSEDHSVINSTTRFASLTQELATRRGAKNGNKNQNNNIITTMDLVPLTSNTNVLINHVAAACNVYAGGFSLSSSAALNSNISHFNLNSATNNNNNNNNTLKNANILRTDSYKNNGSLTSNDKQASIDADKVYLGYIESSHFRNLSGSCENDINENTTELHNSENDDDDNSSLNLSQYNRYKFTNKNSQKQADTIQNGDGKTFSSLESFSDSSKVVTTVKPIEKGLKIGSQAVSNPIFNELNGPNNSEIYLENNPQSPYVDDNSNSKSHIELHELVHANNSQSNSHEVNINVINAVNGIAAVKLSNSKMQIQSGNSGEVSSSGTRDIYNYSPSINNQKNQVNEGDTLVISTSPNTKPLKDKDSNVNGTEVIHPQGNGHPNEKHCPYNINDSQRHRSHHRHHHKCHNNRRKDLNGNIVCTSNNCCIRRVSSLVNASSNFLSHTGDDDTKAINTILMSKKKSKYSKPSNNSKYRSSSRSKGRRKERDSIGNDDTDSSYNSLSDFSENDDSFDKEAEDEDADDYEGVSRPLYVPAVIRKTEEKINVKRYHLTQQQKKKHAFLSIQTNRLSSSNKNSAIHENNNNSFNSTSSYILSPATSLLNPSSPLQRITVTTSISAGINSHGTLPHSFDAHNAAGTNVDSCSSIVSSLQNAMVNGTGKIEGGNKVPNIALNSHVPNSAADRHSLEIMCSTDDAAKHKNNSSNSDISGSIGKRVDRNDSFDKHCICMSDEGNQEGTSANPFKSDSTQQQQQQTFLGMTSPRSSNSSSIMLMRSNNTINWKADDSVLKCPVCNKEFGIFFRRHHCRKCGNIFCDSCSKYRIALDSWGNFRNVGNKFEKSSSINYSYNTSNNEGRLVKKVRSCEKCYKLYREFVRELSLANLKSKQAVQAYTNIKDSDNENNTLFEPSDSKGKNPTKSEQPENEQKKKRKDYPEEDEDEENYEVYENNWSTF